LRAQLEDAKRKLEAYEHPTNRSNNAIVTRSGGPCPHCPKLVEDVKAAKKECKSLRALNDSSLKETDQTRKERDDAKQAAADMQQLLTDTQEALKAQITVLEDDLKEAQKNATEHLLAYTKAAAEIQSLKRNQTRTVPTLQDIESPKSVVRTRGTSISPNSHQSNLRTVNAAQRELADKLEATANELREEKASHQEALSLNRYHVMFKDYAIGCAPQSWLDTIEKMFRNNTDTLERTQLLPLLRHMRESLAQEVDVVARLTLAKYGTRCKRIKSAPSYIMNLCNALMTVTNFACAEPWRAEVENKDTTATLVSQVGLEVELLQSFHTAAAAMTAMTSMFSHPGWMSLFPTRIHPDYRKYCIDRAYRVQNRNFPTDIDAADQFPHPVFGREDWRNPPRAEYHPVHDPTCKLNGEDGLTGRHETDSYVNKELYNLNEEYALELNPEDAEAISEVLPCLEGGFNHRGQREGINEHKLQAPGNPPGKTVSFAEESGSDESYVSAKGFYGDANQRTEYKRPLPLRRPLRGGASGQQQLRDDNATRSPDSAAARGVVENSTYRRQSSNDSQINGNMTPSKRTWRRRDDREEHSSSRGVFGRRGAASGGSGPPDGGDSSSSSGSDDGHSSASYDSSGNKKSRRHRKPDPRDEPSVFAFNGKKETSPRNSSQNSRSRTSSTGRRSSSSSNASGSTQTDGERDRILEDAQDAPLDFYRSLPPPWNKPPIGEPVKMKDYQNREKNTRRFNGTVESYISFRGCVIDEVHRSVQMLPRKFRKLSELTERYLPGRVHNLAPSEDSYRTLIEKLESRYGGVHRGWRFHLRKLSEMPKIDKIDHDRVTALHDSINCYRDALKYCGKEEGDSLSLIQSIMDKLPEATVNDYHDKIMEKGLDESEAYVLKNLMDYIQQYLLRRLNRDADLRASKQDGQDKKDKRKTFVSAQAVTGQVRNAAPVGGPIPVTSTVGVPPPATKEKDAVACVYCQVAGHDLEDCNAFKALPVAEAKKWIMETYLCFRCLKPGHGARDCKTDVECAACSRNHHTKMHDILSHYVPKRTGKTPLKGSANCVQERIEDINRSFAAYVRQSEAEDNYFHHEEDYDSDGLDQCDGGGRAYAMTGYTLASDGVCEMSHPRGELLKAFETGQPVRQYATGVRNVHSISFAVAEITNPQTGKTTSLNVILDGCANLSTFAKRAMQRIEAKGTKSRVCITGFGGDENRQQASLTEIVLKSVGGRFKEKLVVPAINEPVGKLFAVPWHQLKEEWPHLKDLPINIPERDGRVDAIIGTDLIGWHSPFGYRRGKWGDPVGWKFPMGWVITGLTTPMSTEKQKQKHVAHVMTGSVYKSAVSNVITNHMLPVS
jgi:hypothetical protein